MEKKYKEVSSLRRSINLTENAFLMEAATSFTDANEQIIQMAQAELRKTAEGAVVQEREAKRTGKQNMEKLVRKTEELKKRFALFRKTEKGHRPSFLVDETLGVPRFLRHFLCGNGEVLYVDTIGSLRVAFTSQGFVEAWLQVTTTAPVTKAGETTVSTVQTYQMIDLVPLVLDPISSVCRIRIDQRTIQDNDVDEWHAFFLGGNNGVATVVRLGLSYDSDAQHLKVKAALSGEPDIREGLKHVVMASRRLSRQAIHSAVYSDFEHCIVTVSEEPATATQSKHINAWVVPNLQMAWSCNTVTAETPAEQEGTTNFGGWKLNKVLADLGFGPVTCVVPDDVNRCYYAGLRNGSVIRIDVSSGHTTTPDLHERRCTMNLMTTASGDVGSI